MRVAACGETPDDLLLDRALLAEAGRKAIGEDDEVGEERRDLRHSGEPISTGWRLACQKISSRFLITGRN